MHHRRDLPWRRTRDPYRIWLSEVLLQQTRVAQGLPYYLRFIEAYPTVFSLAKATETDVLKLWQGLGYYSRARNLHTTARHIADQLGGIFPGDYQGLLRLPGVGPYTAAAIASFAYDEAVPVFDGNVYRVLSRFYGVREPVNSGAGKKRIEEIGHRLIPAGDPANYNQAIMEFGAMQCKPQTPDCARCPIWTDCSSYRQGMVAELPVKLKKPKARKLHFNYMVFRDNKSRTLVHRRPMDGIWPGLYEFPLWETEAEVQASAIRAYLEDHWVGLGSLLGVELADRSVHKLSHRTIHAAFWRVDLSVELDMKVSVTYDSLQDYPVSVLMERFLAKAEFD